MSSVDASQTNQAGGLQGTAQNLGASLGTALIGAILLGGLTSSFIDIVAADPDITPEVAIAVAQGAEATGLEIVPVSTVPDLLLAAGVPESDVPEITEAYASAQLEGLQNALFAVAVFAVLATWFTRRLPGTSTAAADATDALPAAAEA
jgi:hypothetical protein